MKMYENYTTGRDENKAREILGKIMRHSIGDEEHPSIGVVDVNTATAALMSAYGRINRLEAEIEEIREAILHLAEEPPKTGGPWIGAARTWLQWNKRNGERVTWGSSDKIEPQMTARDVDDLAVVVAKGAGRWLRDKFGIKEKT